ncbi:hypothetical protein TSUD_376650 [Trifolium subterraneum]|uniref:Uncharacterized protein n=1 Tax=Trifolium subterraneum TaxID=3900 RepID=A0A2Z6P3K4_TRISU|nr:hypothetical protein TSUD_376650 [Trifolium subterraneum]
MNGEADVGLVQNILTNVELLSNSQVDAEDYEISHEIVKEQFEMEELVGKRLQALKDHVAKVMTKYGTVLEPSTPIFT